jgi:CelD/BcsL family acetyltransferase involved in cellulose biosynthesis
MLFELHEDIGAFEALRPEWTQLLQRGATNTVFLTCEWQQAWWNTFGADRTLQLITLRNEDEHLEAIIPLFVQETRLNSSARLPHINIESPPTTPEGDLQRTVHFIGGSEVSDYLDIIAPPELNTKAWASVFKFLERQQSWQNLDLRSMPAASPTIPSVTRLARQRGWELQQAREDVCPILELPSTWDAYLADQLDKKKRHELRRKMRKAEGEVDVRWYWVEPYNLDVGLQIFFELHRASDPDKDVFMTGRMESFFQAVTEAARDSGWLRLAVLRFDGHAVASYLCFDYGGDRLVYNSGFDTSTYGHLSPGIVLLAFLIEDAIAQRLRHFDFLQGDERYKYDFGAADTEVLRLFIRR